MNVTESSAELVVQGWGWGEMFSHTISVCRWESTDVNSVDKMYKLCLIKNINYMFN